MLFARADVKFKSILGLFKQPKRKENSSLNGVEKFILRVQTFDVKSSVHLPNSWYGSCERVGRFFSRNSQPIFVALGQVVKNSGLIEIFRWMPADKEGLCK